MPAVIASVRAMGWFKRRRDLDLQPLSELHDEFETRPGADALLAEAEEELAQRERTDSGYAEQHTAEA